MKKNIVKMLIASIFAVLAILNFSANIKSGFRDTNLIQQAQANTYLCAEYYGGEIICCLPKYPGDCFTGWGDYYGPFYP